MRFVHFPGDDRFLLVSAGHRTRNGNRALSASYVEFVDKSVRVLPYFLKPDKTAFLEFGFEITLQNHILFERIVENKSVLMPVFRNVRYAVNVSVPYAFIGYFFVFKINLTFFRLFKSGQRVYELGLPVSVDTCYTNYFAGSYR